MAAWFIVEGVESVWCGNRIDISISISISIYKSIALYPQVIRSALFSKCKVVFCDSVLSW